MEDGINLALYEDVMTYVVMNELEVLISCQMGNVARITRQEIVQPNDAVPLGKKPITQMRPKEASGSGNKDSQLPTLS